MGDLQRTCLINLKRQNFKISVPTTTKQERIFAMCKADGQATDIKRNIHFLRT